ncbi:MAG TPA: glycosyltransferase 87 family protein [Streptosporangiaceae bacterium]|nr:glycosyltransferase 87 family protein [Streptosporangiaceae bacterium]
MLLLRQAPLRRCEPGRGWQSPVTVPRLWLAAMFAACALFAGGMGVFSTDALHRLWGLFAAGAYVLAAGAVLAWKSARGVDLALFLGLGGALIAPLSVLAEQGRWQPEVGVIARGARLLVHHGSPYESQAVIAASHNPNIYDPYLPAMALFGIPRALFGPGLLTDPRIWFCLGFAAVFAAALAASGARDVLRWTALVTATPVIAFSLTVGGTDIPVLALLCLGLALLWRRPQPIAAGLVLGVAAATKATAWPALIVAAAMLLVRDGRRAVVRFLVAAIAAASVIIGPVAALWPHTLVENTILFPLGLASVKSQAVSPLPGHVLADTGHAGHLIAVSLLCLAGLGVLASLVVRPPRNVPSATWRLIIGLVLMFALAPATRFGYFMYPLGLWAWLTVSRLGAQRPTATRAGPGGEGPQAPPPGGLPQASTA